LKAAARIFIVRASWLTMVDAWWQPCGGYDATLALRGGSDKWSAESCDLQFVLTATANGCRIGAKINPAAGRLSAKTADFDRRIARELRSRFGPDFIHSFPVQIRLLGAVSLLPATYANGMAPIASHAASGKCTPLHRSSAGLSRT
jgi:hypothetical protein